ncbi:hypothetical protein P167DRAFT_490511, partial [Morchella conica CCBAS932]
RELGKHWISRFVNRHPILDREIATRIDRHRAIAENRSVLEYFFQLVCVYPNLNS